MKEARCYRKVIDAVMKGMGTRYVVSNATLTLGERVGGVEAAAILCGLIGTLLVVKPPAVFGGADAAPLDPTGVVVTLLAAAFCSVAMISVRYIGKRASPLVLAVWFHGSSTVAGAMACLAGWPGAPVSPTAVEWGLLLLISFTSFFGGGDLIFSLLFFSLDTRVSQSSLRERMYGYHSRSTFNPVCFAPGLWRVVTRVPCSSGQVSLNYGYQTLPTLRASALYYGMVVWAAVLGAVFLRESVDAYGGCGAAVIAVGGLMPSVGCRRGRGGGCYSCYSCSYYGCVLHSVIEMKSEIRTHPPEHP